MDFFQGAVEDYLRADRASFNNPEFYLQRSEVYESGKSNWYVDVLNINFRDETVYLCEVTYARNPMALRNRLLAWKENWEVVVAAIRRDAKGRGCLSEAKAGEGLLPSKTPSPRRCAATLSRKRKEEESGARNYFTNLFPVIRSRFL